MTQLFLTRIRLNQGRIAGLWASNPYRVHQRLLMACSGDPRLLFRIEEDERAGQNMQIIIQSHLPPDIDRAFGDFPVLAGAVESKPFELKLAEHRLYRFRLLANPTVKRAGKRLGLLNESEQTAWLGRKLAEAGAELQSSWVKPWRLIRSERNPAKAANIQTHVAVQFEGILEACDPHRLCEAVEHGIGSAKGFGFGLLSLARAAG